MQGNPKIHTYLSDLLASELAAVNSYFLAARTVQNWGYAALAKKLYDESIGEMRHAEEMIDRILFLDGVPNLQRLGRVRGGATVREFLEGALDIEVTTRTSLVEGITLCREEGDDGTRLMLEPMLSEGEETIDWLETQLSLIEQLGEPLYLAQQLGEGEGA